MKSSTFKFSNSINDRLCGMSKSSSDSYSFELMDLLRGSHLKDAFGGVMGVNRGYIIGEGIIDVIVIEGAD